MPRQSEKSRKDKAPTRKKRKSTTPSAQDKTDDDDKGAKEQQQQQQQQQQDPLSLTAGSIAFLPEAPSVGSIQRITTRSGGLVTKPFLTDSCAVLCHMQGVQRVKHFARAQLKPFPFDSQDALRNVQDSVVKAALELRTDMGDDAHFDFCWVCQERGRLVLCDTCANAYHYDCHAPLLTETPDEDEAWSCVECLGKPSPLDSAAALLDRQKTLLATMVELDAIRVFAHPTPLEYILPTYAAEITQPMDLMTMRHKVYRKCYGSLDAMQQDAELMVRNCINFSSQDPHLTGYAGDFMKGVNAAFEGAQMALEAARHPTLVGTPLLHVLEAHSAATAVKPFLSPVPPGGIQFRASLRVSIFCSSASLHTPVIRYTLDGSPPEFAGGKEPKGGNGSRTYRDPILIGASCTVKAVAFHKLPSHRLEKEDEADLLATAKHVLSFKKENYLVSGVLSVSYNFFDENAATSRAPDSSANAVMAADAVNAGSTANADPASASATGGGGQQLSQRRRHHHHHHGALSMHPTATAGSNNNTSYSSSHLASASAAGKPRATPQYVAQLTHFLVHVSSAHRDDKFGSKDEWDRYAKVVTHVQRHPPVATNAEFLHLCRLQQQQSSLAVPGVDAADVERVLVDFAEFCKLNLHKA